MSDLIGHKIPATLIPGDGIGPEVLKGPLTTPVGGGFRSSNVRLREEFELLANVRPARTLIPGRFDDIDLVLVRENLGGFYVAHEYVPIGNDPRAVAVSTGINTRDGTKRIARFAFEYALEHGCKKITIVHKANILKASSGLFLEAAREVAADTRAASRSTTRSSTPAPCSSCSTPGAWTWLCTNLLGDILSDEIAGLVRPDMAAVFGSERTPSLNRSSLLGRG